MRQLANDFIDFLGTPLQRVMVSEYPFVEQQPVFLRWLRQALLTPRNRMSSDQFKALTPNSACPRHPLLALQGTIRKLAVYTFPQDENAQRVAARDDIPPIDGEEESDNAEDNSDEDENDELSVQSDVSGLVLDVCEVDLT